MIEEREEVTDQEAQEAAAAIGGRVLSKDEAAARQEYKCKGCGKPIIWAKSETGKNVPLDPLPTIYVKQPTGVWKRHDPAKKPAYISHFYLCKKASDYSGSNKKAGQ